MHRRHSYPSQQRLQQQQAKQQQRQKKEQEQRELQQQKKLQYQRQQEIEVIPKPLLVLVVGGPCSGKTSVGAAVQAAMPGFVFVSCSDLARLAVSDNVVLRSQSLFALSKKLKCRQSAQHAATELNGVVINAVGEGWRKCLTANNKGGLSMCGLVISGIRASDLKPLEEATASPARCIVYLHCTGEVLIKRMASRGARVGDDRLRSSSISSSNISSSIGDAGSTAKDAGDRICAYLDREEREQAAMKAHFSGRKEFVNAFKCVDGCAALPEVISTVLDALSHLKTGAERRMNRGSLTSTPFPAPQIDWFQAFIGASGFYPTAAMGRLSEEAKGRWTESDWDWHPSFETGHGLTPILESAEEEVASAAGAAAAPAEWSSYQKHGMQFDQSDGRDFGWWLDAGGIYDNEYYYQHCK